MSLDSAIFAISKPSWQQLTHPTLLKNNIDLWVCQLPTKPSQLSGNKWLKLKYHLAAVKQLNKQGIVTFGGAFSNHIAAVAVACQQLNLTSLTYLRADNLDLNNPTIKFCLELGMQFKLLSRKEYRLRTSHSFYQRIEQAHPELLLVPEGGSSVAAVKGIAELNLTDTPAGKADLIALATASGGTLAGVISANSCDILGIAAVKDPTIPERIEQLIPQSIHAERWSVNLDFTEAGYAKFSPELLAFCLEISEHNIKVEPIYSGKALYGLFQLIEQGKLHSYKRISFFHTGGMQGLDGLLYRKLISVADYALLAGYK
jgi:1-aminocyclopropane-1-carboxylate deaminase